MTERSSHRALRILIGLAVLGVLLGVLGFVMPRAFGDVGDGAARKQVATRAEDFATTVNTYDYADIKDYRARMKTLLTPDYYKVFLENSDATASVLQKNKITLKGSDAKVVGLGVTSIDDDSAEVMVAVDASITSDDEKVGAVRKFRWNVSLVKNDGDWRVSKFEAVAAVGAEATPIPSATPSTGGGAE